MIILKKFDLILDCFGFLSVCFIRSQLNFLIAFFAGIITFTSAYVYSSIKNLLSRLKIPQTIIWRDINPQPEATNPQQQFIRIKSKEKAEVSRLSSLELSRYNFLISSNFLKTFMLGQCWWKLMAKGDKRYVSKKFIYLGLFIPTRPLILFL